MRAIPKCLLKRGGVLVTEVVEAKRGKWERGASAYGARVVNEEDRGGKRGGGAKNVRWMDCVLILRAAQAFCILA